jgi:hypothetical protein
MALCQFFSILTWFYIFIWIYWTPKKNFFVYYPWYVTSTCDCKHNYYIFNFHDFKQDVVPVHIMTKTRFRVCWLIQYKWRALSSHAYLMLQGQNKKIKQFVNYWTRMRMLCLKVGGSYKCFRDSVLTTLTWLHCLLSQNVRHVLSSRFHNESV